MFQTFNSWDYRLFSKSCRAKPVSDVVAEAAANSASGRVKEAAVAEAVVVDSR